MGPASSVTSISRAEIEINSSVAGWDDHALFCQRARNYTKKPIDLEIRRSFGGHVIFRSDLSAKKFITFRQSSTRRRSSRAKRRNCSIEIVQRQGHNAKQNNVTIERATVKP